MTRFRFVFVVFYFTGILTLTVYLRHLNNHTFYQLSAESAQQARLNEHLGEKQLRVEELTNPSAVSERLEEPKSESKSRRNGSD